MLHHFIIFQSFFFYSSLAVILHPVVLFTHLNSLDCKVGFFFYFFISVIHTEVEGFFARPGEFRRSPEFWGS